MTADLEISSKSASASIARSRLLPLIALGAALVVAPFFLRGSPASVAVFLALVLVVPHGLTAIRLVRNPSGREGPGLALGIGLVLTVAGAILCVLALREPGFLRVAYALALVVSQLATMTFGAIGFRRGVSAKPAWRVLGRSIVDPVAYYGLVTLIMIVAVGRH